jgi:hypothetical protein
MMLSVGHPIACPESFWGKMRGYFMRGTAMLFFAAIAEQKTRARSGSPPRIRRFPDKIAAIKDGQLEPALPLEILTGGRPGRNDTSL